ncbi:MAG: LLM class flavin-dependent oxidoreductase [Actinomycetota bacterium]
MADRDDRIKIGVQDPTRPPYTVTKILVRVAERVRLDSYWMIDHLQGVVPTGMWSKDLTPAARMVKNPDEFFDPFVILGGLATKTRRIRFGTAVTDTVRLHPVTIARAALTLQHVSKGRFILGIGAGERENTEPYGLSLAKSASRFEEALKVIRLLWSSRDPFDFDGEFYKLKGAILSLRPYLKRPPPIWVAAMGPRMLETAGRYADGWLPHTLTVDRYDAALRRLRTAAASGGRDPLSITPGLVITGLFDSSHETCHAVLESPALKLGALIIDANAWSDAGGVHPFGESFGGIRDFVPNRFSPDDVQAAMEKVPWEVVHALFPHGTPEEMALHIRAFERVGLRHVVFNNITAIGKPQKAVASFTALVRCARLLRRGGPS